MSKKAARKATSEKTAGKKSSPVSDKPTSKNTTSNKAAPPHETVTLRIARQAGPQAARQWQRFELKPGAAVTVADLLRLLNRTPRTVDGTEVAPVVWLSSCAWPCCGSCMMRINGRATPACSSDWRCLLDKRKELVIEPLGTFPIVADLHVDRSSMLADMLALHTWTAASDEPPEPTAPAEPAAPMLGICTQCGACHDACPVVGGGAPFAGPAALFESHRASRLAGAQRDEEGRVAALRGDRGVHACGFAFACADACPAALPLDEIVTERSATATRDGLRRLFNRR